MAEKGLHVSNKQELLLKSNKFRTHLLVETIAATSRLISFNNPKKNEVGIKKE